MYNCSLFGLGRAGKIHYKNIINNKFLNLKYIYDLEENIKDIENKVDSKIKVTSSLDDILRDREVTISIICTPTNFHYSFIKVSLRNGNHVLCEKPLSNSEEEIIECYELANSQNLVLLCALNRRFDPEIINLKNKISTIGKIHKVMTISRDYPYPTLDYLKISSGIFHDCAVHDIDYINWILDDKPINVYTTGNKVFMVDKGGDELDNAIIIMEYANGIIGLVNISRISTNYDQRIEIYGTNDVLTMINPFGDIDTFNESPISFPERYDESYKNELAHLIAVIKGEEIIGITLNDCINSLRIVNACEESYKNSMKVSIKYAEGFRN